MAVAEPMLRASEPDMRLAREPRPTVRRRRSLADRITLNLVVGVVAALLAFVLAATLLRDRREMSTIAVARESVPAGAAITPELVRGVQVPANSELVQSMVLLSDVVDDSRVATRPIAAGEPLHSSALGMPADVDARRVMSLSLEPWQAANGAIGVGDEIDIIRTAAGVAEYVITGGLVVDRSSDDGGGGLVSNRSSGELVLSIEVDDRQALLLAQAISDGEITVVRATGAPVIAAAPTSGGG